jgi:very-short-patch-repair endonuclease
VTDTRDFSWHAPGVGYNDFPPNQELCVELDGPGHERARTRREDAEHDARRHAAGYDVVRVPEEVITGPLPARIRPIP